MDKVKFPKTLFVTRITDGHSEGWWASNETIQEAADTEDCDTVGVYVLQKVAKVVRTPAKLE